jgi:hypothetical protein
VPLAALDRKEFAAIADRLDQALVGVELGAQLIEIGDLQARSVPYPPRVRLQLLQQDTQQRGFAGAVRPDQSNAVVA